MAFSAMRFLIVCVSLCPHTGLDAELYYVRDDVVNTYALSFTLPVPSETSSLHFTWHSTNKVVNGYYFYMHTNLLF